VVGGESTHVNVAVVNRIAMRKRRVTIADHLPAVVDSEENTGFLVALADCLNLVTLAGLAFGVVLLIRRVLGGPQGEGVFTLFALVFVLRGLLILAVGLVGEYVGRIYLEVRRRPTYRMRAVHRHGDG